jgi:hypothetical protein
MYVVSTKPAGFSIEVTNQDSSLVMTGVRVMLGTQETLRAPSYVEVHVNSCLCFVLNCEEGVKHINLINITISTGLVRYT